MFILTWSQCPALESTTNKKHEWNMQVAFSSFLHLKLSPSRRQKGLMEDGNESQSAWLSV